MSDVLSIRELLEAVVEKGASDLHLTINTPPVLRVHGDLMVLEDKPVLTADTLKKLIYSILTDSQKEKFEKDKELDFSFSLPQMDRFRINVHVQRGAVEAAFRRIPAEIPSFERLGLPLIIQDLARMPNGLVLITGPTGMGKSTTMAAMVDLVNRERKRVIVSIEDPIEFIHANKMSIVKQREVYADTLSFSEALKRALRQDPDLIMVGEMRDLETISTALTAAETGHLVFATLHTPDAPQTIQRIIDVFPPHQQAQIRLQLADCLQGVVAQLLLPRKDGLGRTLATEIMVATPAVRNLIREAQVAHIPTIIQTGAKYGMKSMDKTLKELYAAGVISFETAREKAKNKDEFAKL